MEESQLEVHIRWMIRRDMPEILRIEEEAFEFPWSEEDFIRCLRQRNTIGMVAEYKDAVVGFMIYDLLKHGLHLESIAVDASHRSRRIGRQMVDKLIGKLSAQRRTRIATRVREHNLAGQLFFKAAGFVATSTLRSPFEDSTEDAYLMEYHYGREKFQPRNRIKKYLGAES